MTIHEITQAILNADVRALSDAQLELAEAVLHEAQFALPTVEGMVAFSKVNREIGRRAEIRIERHEFSGSHPGSWYDSRPLVFEQFEKGEPVLIDPDAETTYANRTGFVESQHPETGTVVVALDNGPWHSALKLPFAASEVRHA